MRHTRLERSLDILERAWRQDNLQAGSTVKDAVGTLVKTGDFCEDLMPMRWFDLLTRRANGRLTIEDSLDVSKLEASVGYTIDELILIEQAFEGAPITLAGGSRRLSTGFSISLDERFENVIEVLFNIEKERESREDMYDEQSCRT